MKRLLHFIKYLPQAVFRLVLSLSSSAYVVVVFLIKEGITFPFFPQKLVYISYLIYLIIPMFVAYLCLFLSQHLSVCGMECQIKEVELASHSFLPNYLGYFFVALSVPNLISLLFIYAVIFIFTHLSQALSFNPMFLLFGYQFYFVTGEDGTKIFLITKQKMKPYQDANLNNLCSINDFTFIDMG